MFFNIDLIFILTFFGFVNGSTENNQPCESSVTSFNIHSTIITYIALILFVVFFLPLVALAGGRR